MKREVLTKAGLSAAVLLLAIGPVVAQANDGGPNVGGDVKGGANVKGGDTMPSASPNTSTDVKGDVKGDIKGGVNADSPSASPRIDDSTTTDNPNKARSLNSDKAIDK